jgi:putative spermidine/putrescine transport system ATP-binding protein
LVQAGEPLDIRIAGVSKHYDGVAALDDVNLEIASREFMTLLGPSGSGKSTLLMVLAGFVRPDQGQVSFAGSPMLRVPAHRRNVGMVFQKHALFPHMSVFDNIAYPLRLRKNGREEVEQKVSEVLSLVRLDGYGSRRVDQLSGGQSQRVAVARAIVFSPRILLMDEPLSALDKNLREQLQLEIRALHDKLGVTTVYVTHDQREALTMSDRIAVMDRGHVVQADEPRRLYERPVDSFVAQFIGETTLVPVVVGAETVSLLGVSFPRPPSVASGERDMSLVVRPGMIEVCDVRATDGDYIYFSGTVIRPVFEGESWLYLVDCGKGTVLSAREFTRDVGARQLGPGSRTMLRLHRRDFFLTRRAT